jgi:RND family efflux transporter MFP subunit
MHPAYKSDRPGVAPDCGMKLEPVYEGDPMADPTKAGLLNITSEKQQLIGVEYGVVDMASTSSSFRAVGRVTQDETRVVRIHPKIEGWIEKVHVDFMGARVEQGQPLLTIYSPAMLAAQQEYLLAIQARNVLKESPLKEAAENSDSLIRASRMRLELWDVGRAQMDELEKTGQPMRTITLFAPANGYVIARNAFTGQKVTPDTELYALTDLSRVWVVADVFESDAANVRVGQNAVVSLPQANGKRFSGRVSYILPQVDPATRTLKVRLEAPNPELQLKPDMFVEVEFQLVSSRKLTVPSEAVLDAGLRKTVFVDHGNGNLEARQVETGERLGDRIEILHGLKAGERIVTSGNFLIDSESQLKQPAAAPSPHAGHAGAGEHSHD